jgi:hypothetical protein
MRHVTRPRRQCWLRMAGASRLLPLRTASLAPNCLTLASGAPTIRRTRRRSVGTPILHTVRPSGSIVRTHATTAVLERKGRIGPRQRQLAGRQSLVGWLKRREQHPTGGVEAVIGNLNCQDRGGSEATATRPIRSTAGGICVASNKCNQSHWVRAGGSWDHGAISRAAGRAAGV